METEKYNGWTNYETWAVYTWLTNEQSSYLFMMDLKTEALKEDYPKSFLADRIKEVIEEGQPETPGLYTDLLTHAISRANYYEIAEAFLE